MTAQTIWSYQDNFDFRLDVGPDSPLHHALEQHRGDYSRRSLLNTFNLDSKGCLRAGARPKSSEPVLFGGHIGCGKSTELRDYEELLKNSYTVRRLDLTKILDLNNLRFSDLLMALAQSVVDCFGEKDLSLRPASVFVDPVLQWFETRIIKQERFKDIEGELKTEVKAQGGIPLLASLLATLTAKVRGGASYREELRREVADGFSSLVGHFNALMTHANDLLERQTRGPLLFIIDGTDKLKKEDAASFFEADINQLGQIRTNLILCAPISVLLESSQAAQRFTRVQLPMVKIFEADGSARPDDENALIDLVLKRLPLEFFDDRETLRFLVQSSGGHVRDLLRLIRAAFSAIPDTPEVITRPVAERAVRAVASEYQRLVQKDDWADLVLIDRSQGQEKDRTDQRLRLLHDLVLLEFNSFWWRSHPLVQTLPAYSKALAAADDVTS